MGKGESVAIGVDLGTSTWGIDCLRGGRAGAVSICVVLSSYIMYKLKLIRVKSTHPYLYN